MIFWKLSSPPCGCPGELTLGHNERIGYHRPPWKECSEENEQKTKSPPVRKSRLRILCILGASAGKHFVKYCWLPLYHYSLVTPALFCSCCTVVNAHPIVGVLQAPKVLIWPGWAERHVVGLSTLVQASSRRTPRRCKRCSGSSSRAGRPACHGGSVQWHSRDPSGPTGLVLLDPWLTPTPGLTPIVSEQICWAFKLG